ncbi:MAG: TlpA disulfide reductase family protein [Pseudomonadota bacterium]
MKTYFPSKSAKDILCVLFVVLFFCAHIYLKVKYSPSFQAGNLTQAVTFNLPSLNNEVIDLEKLAKSHRIVIVNFWEQWCGPCLKEMPYLQKIYEEHNQNEVAIIGIFSSSSKQSVEKFISENKITFPIVYDTSSAVNKKYNVKAIPSTFLIDSNLRIIKSSTGFDQNLKNVVENYLKDMSRKST